MSQSVKWVAIGIDLRDEAAQGKKLVGIRIAGKKLAFAQHAGKWYAFQQSCPHAGGNLSNGLLTAEGCIECPLHRYAFDIRTGENTTGEGFHIETYPVKEDRGLWWIGFPKRKWFNWF